MATDVQRTLSTLASNLCELKNLFFNILPFSTMASSETNCYRHTKYGSLFVQLRHFGKNADKTRFVYCPKKVCKDSKTELYTPYYLYRHIEEAHPNDRLHKWNYSKNPQNDDDECFDNDVFDHRIDDSFLENPSLSETESLCESSTDDFLDNFEDLQIESGEAIAKSRSIIDHAKEDQYFEGLMDIMSKYKFSQGVPSKVVNSIVLDMLELNKSTGMETRNFSLYTKVAASDFLQDVFIERHYTDYLKPLVCNSVTDVDGTQYKLDFTRMSLIAICQRALQNKSLVDHLTSERSSNRHPNPAIQSLLDGSFSSRIRGQLKLEFYIDDTNIAPSGIFNKNQKFICVYMTIADIPYKHRTKSDDIFIVLLVNRKKFQNLNLKEPFTALFADMKKEIYQLNQAGLQVTDSHGNLKTIRATISAILGDNLGIYQFLGFSCSFRNNSFICRFCSARGQAKKEEDIDIQELFTRRKLVTGKTKSDAEKLGIKYPFVFDGVCGVNRWNVAPPDAMHDLAEGAVPAILELLLTSITENYQLASSSTRFWSAASRRIIEAKFATFKFYEGTPHLTWISSSDSKKKGFKLEGTAAQKLECLLKLEAILFEELDAHWPEFELYSLLRQFTLLTFSPKFDSGETKQFEPLANRIMELCQSLKPEFEIFCKLHHLCHYGELTELFGPLYMYATFRYEHKHQYSKMISRLTKNFKNPAMSIHSRHQKKKAVHEKQSNYNTFPFFEERPRNMNPLLHNLPEGCTKLPSSKHLYSTKKNILRKLMIRRDLYFQTSAFYIRDESMYCIGKVFHKCQTQNGNRKSDFLKHRNLYVLEQCYTEEKCILYDDLLHANDFIFTKNNVHYLLEWIC